MMNIPSYVAQVHRPMGSPKFLPLSTEHGERDPHVIGHYEGGSKNSIVEMRALKMKKVEDKNVVLTTNNF